MIHGFYFRFYKLIHNDFICAMLAHLAFLVYKLLYILKKIKRKKVSVDMSVEDAQKLISEKYTPSTINPIIQNKDIDKHMDLSVIIPVYNHKDILSDCIDSILNQDTKYNYEVILVDDGSTDGADEIVKNYESNYKVKAIFQKNGGIAVARNTGINNAVGKYLMFIDCDDTVHSDIVEKLMNEAYKDNYDMVMAAHNLVKEKDGKVIDVIPNVYSKFNLMGFKNNDKILNLAGLPWGKVYKREFWNSVRYYPGFWYEDNIIHFLIFTQIKKYSYIREVEYEYKWFDQNFSHTQNNKKSHKVIDSYSILLRILETYEDNKFAIDDKFYTVLLRHLSAYYYPLMSEFEDELQNAVFVVANNLYKKYKPNHKVKLPYMLKQVEKAFDTNDIELWKLASCYQ